MADYKATLNLPNTAFAMKANLPQREPDMTYVEGTTRRIRERLRRGQLVVLESTTYPGTTDELVRKILEESGLKCGTDFYLAFSPEREDPGNAKFSTATIPKVIGGVDAVSGDLAEALYSEAIAKTVRVSSARAAEATKLLCRPIKATSPRRTARSSRARAARA